MSAALRVTYRLQLASGESAARRALRLAHEQTVELPPEAVPPGAEALLARVEAVENLGPGEALATLAFDPETAGADLAGLLVLLFGNVSLECGVRLEEISWPGDLLARFAGPRFGIDGLRALCGVRTQRALLCGVTKPLGLPSAELARRCGEIARGGADLIKDDHGIADPPTSPFAERVARCQEAIATANARTGGVCLYVPNLTGPAATLPQRLETLRALGCQAALVAPLPLGLETVRTLAAESGLALFAHPALAGAFFAPEHGIAPEVLLGDLFRIAGCDAVIYPHQGGRFPFPAASSAALREHLRRPLGALRPAFAVPGGGIEPARVPGFLAETGSDTIFLVGSHLYLAPDLFRATADLAAAVRGGTA
ncbi:MAG TPA: RuBisCO large subunit C-terminal-like domain-containing protein [Thermoanaerobaculia bacterium]|nr:RuBisCO large subunit C-terminal-like domain-containing protein [Thermoanaerobaculia bacterium]